MKIPYDVIEDAFLQTSDSYEHTILLNRKTGEIHNSSDEDSWFDEDENEPEFEEDWVEVPNKFDLNLGKILVERFTRSLMPDQQAVIGKMHGSGFYSRYKHYLASIDELDNWHEYENEQTKIALTDWCESEEIQLAE